MTDIHYFTAQPLVIAHYSNFCVPVVISRRYIENWTNQNTTTRIEISITIMIEE